MVQYFYSLGMLLRMILDFNSYKSAGDSLYSETSQSDFQQEEADDYDYTMYDNIDVTRQNLVAVEANEQSKRRPRFWRKNFSKEGHHPTLMKGEGYKWNFWDYAQAPFALTVGALSALPQDSFGFACSIYIQSSR